MSIDDHRVELHNRTPRRKTFWQIFPWVEDVNKINQKLFGNIVELGSTVILDAMDYLIQKLSVGNIDYPRAPKLAKRLARYLRRCIYVYHYLCHPCNLVSSIPKLRYYDQSEFQLNSLHFLCFYHATGSNILSTHYKTTRHLHWFGIVRYATGQWTQFRRCKSYTIYVSYTYAGKLQDLSVGIVYSLKNLYNFAFFSILLQCAEDAVVWDVFIQMERFSSHHGGLLSCLLK